MVWLGRDFDDLEVPPTTHDLQPEDVQRIAARSFPWQHPCTSTAGLDRRRDMFFDRLLLTVRKSAS
jgi:hypothetical protein